MWFQAFIEIQLKCLKGENTFGTVVIINKLQFKLNI